jgi:hypothetical protein
VWLSRAAFIDSVGLKAPELGRAVGRLDAAEDAAGGAVSVGVAAASDDAGVTADWGVAAEPEPQAPTARLSRISNIAGAVRLVTLRSSLDL